MINVYYYATIILVCCIRGENGNMCIIKNHSTSAIKVSVIIPIYNAEKYLDSTIQSLICQTFKDFEVIVVNDGSTDLSKQIIDRYKECIDFIYIEQKNSGPSVARNVGINIAKGEYICFLDSDDILPANSIEFRYKLAQSQNVDLVIGGTNKFDGFKEWQLRNHFFGDGYKDIVNNPNLFLSMGSCNKLFKRELLNDIRFPCTLNYAEDHVFMAQVYLKASKNIFTTNEVVYLYRQRINDNNSLSQQMHTKSSQTLNQILEVCAMITQNVNCSNIISRDKLIFKLNYLNRLLRYDIWPTLKCLILCGDVKNFSKACRFTREFLKVVNLELNGFNSKFQNFLSKTFFKKYLDIMSHVHIISPVLIHAFLIRTILRYLINANKISKYTNLRPRS